MSDLDAEARHVYAVVALASSFRYDLSKEDVLVAVGDNSNRSLNVIDQLVRRHLLVATEQGMLRSRHRVIAEIVRDRLQVTGELKNVLPGLALAIATKVTPEMSRSTRPWKLLRSITNHDFLIRTIGNEAARNFYGELETILSWDSHFWLQRGSLEVEARSLARAENFLDQAKGLAPDDPLVETEQAYLTFCFALNNPRGVDAPKLAARATFAPRGFDSPSWNDR